MITNIINNNSFFINCYCFFTKDVKNFKRELIKSIHFFFFFLLILTAKEKHRLQKLKKESVFDHIIFLNLKFKEKHPTYG